MTLINTIKEDDTRPELTPDSKWVYLFDQAPFYGDELVEKTGGKGASLVEMTRMGLPVPPGFTITTDAWQETMLQNNGQLSDQIWQHTLAAVTKLEQQMFDLYGKQVRLDDPNNPLTFSLRSGAKKSMPGMMDTILDLGINDQNVVGLAQQVGEVCAWSSYARLIEMYSVSVYGINQHVFDDAREQFKQHLNKAKQDGRSFNDVEKNKKLVEWFKHVVHREKNIEFEQDVYRQLYFGIQAVFNSFYNPSAIDYRNRYGISHDIGTAVNFQIMVYGNSGQTSGSAVIFTRDRKTGLKGKIDGDFIINGQGEDVVSGKREVQKVKALPDHIHQQLTAYRDDVGQSPIQAIEEWLHAVGDIEITWENGKVWFLQARRAKLAAFAAIRTTIDLVNEGLISLDEALYIVTVDQIRQIKQPFFDEQAKKAALYKNLRIAHGEPVLSGIGVGQIYLHAQKAKAALKQGKRVALFCKHFNPNDVELIFGVRTETGEPNSLQAVVTTIGGPSGHMGLVLSEAGVAGIMGCADIKEINQTTGTIAIGKTVLCEGDVVSVDGNTGEIFSIPLPITPPPALPDDMQAFNQHYQASWGKDNGYAAFLFPADKQKDRYTYLATCQAVHTDTLVKYPTTTKTQDVYFLTRILPAETAIQASIVEVADFETGEEQIKAQITTLIEQAERMGCSIYLRSDNEQLLAPYCGTDFTKDPQALKDWLNNKASKHSRWGGLKSWVTNHGVKYIIVPFDPKDKLNPQKKAQHFVATLRCKPSTPHELVIDIADNTYHLRSFDAIEACDKFQIMAVANPDVDSHLGQINLHFGTSHFDQAKISNLLSQLQKIDHPHVLSLKRTLTRIYKQIDFDKLTNFELTTMLTELMDKNLLKLPDYLQFINDRSLQVVAYVTETVLEGWWQQYALPHLMWAIQETNSAKVLEIQGRLSEDGPIWLKIYGTKGEEEAAKKTALN